MLNTYSIKNIHSHFEYKELTKIDGEPTLDSILLLHRQINQNAQSVPTTLGGGQLGYLGLVIATYKSSCGNQYLIVMYNYDSNVIVFEPLKTRQSKEMAQAFQKCCTKLRIQPNDKNLFILDNECSQDIKKYYKNFSCRFPISTATSTSMKCGRMGY